MSRLIVENLPSKVDPEKLKSKFSETGQVTDVQLRFTPDGKFRKFAFIGYKTPEEAALAIEHFNDTFYNTSKIKVEICADLGSSEKPRAWSKHTKKPDVTPTPPPQTQIKDKKKKKQVDEDLLVKLNKHKDEPEFKEFLEFHGSEDVVGLCDKEDSAESGIESCDGDQPEVSAAHATISDLEYLKLKTKTNEDKEQTQIEQAKPSKQIKSFFNIKIKNLPKSVKKRDIKQLFKDIATPASIRIARGVLGIAYIGFKTEKEMRKALVKNKSFVKGKQIWVSESVQRKEVEREAPEKWKKEEEGLVGEESVGESGRIFIRNLCYTATEEDIQQLFSKYGQISQVNLPLDKFTRKIKGYGTVTFLFPEHAVAAYTALDGTSFQGRMLHLLPAKAVEEEPDIDPKNYKMKKQDMLKKTAGYSHNWNTLFLGRNAVAEVIADTYKASKQDVLTGREGAVRLALGETQLVSQTKQFLLEQGICLDAFNQPPSSRSKNVILVKNLPANTTSEEIKEKFEKFGVLGRVVLPPSGIMAVVEFEQPAEARSAFMKLAYSKFKNMPLYLEWAPENTFASIKTNEVGDVVKEEEEEESEDEPEDVEPDTTLYVKNLSFETTEEDLKRHFSGCGKLASVSVSRKRDVKNPGKMLSLGYGFVQFYLRSSVNKALADLQGSFLQGHSLELKRSDRTSKPLVLSTRKTANVKKQTGSKILVRNVPFQADISEVRKLFGTFGQIKCIRMPKKLVGTGKHRGFCFVEYTTKHEAKAAMKALCQSTHLYGRRLVLEWADTDDTEVETIRKRTAQHFNDELSMSGGKKSSKAVADLNHQSESEDD